jgi:hypothetical protein
VPAVQGFFPFTFDPWANVYAGDRMTALILGYTREGFIIGADGKGNYPNMKPKFGLRKIFEGHNKANFFAYSLTGLTLFKRHGCKCNFVDDSQAIVTDHRDRLYQTADDYINAIARELKCKMQAARGYTHNDFQTTENETDKGFLVSRLTFAGYFNALPFLKTAVIRHRDQNINMENDIHGEEMRLGYPSPVEGPHPIALKSLIREDARLLKYRNDLAYPYGNSLEAAATFIKAYIELCYDPIAQDTAKRVDHELYKMLDSTGEHVHIAEITPSGFKWRIEPTK